MKIPTEQSGMSFASASNPASEHYYASMCRPVRVAFLTPSLVMGGAERWMMSLAKHCDSQQIQWVGTILTPYAAVKLEMTSLFTQHMPIYGPPEVGDSDSDDVIRCKSIEDAMSRVVSKADVLVAWGMPKVGDITGKLSIPLIYASHGAGQWTANALRSSESQCTHFTAVSKAAVAPYSDRVRPTVKVLHNGIDTDRCQVSISRAEFRHKLEIPQQATIIGYIGRYSYEKNPLAAALAVRRIDNPSVYALYCGEGWKSKEVMSDVKSLIGDRAIFLPFQENVGNVLNAIDVSILTSPSEGFSLGLTEAWYCGVPSVATRVGAIPELEPQFGQLVASVSRHPSTPELIAGVQEALSAQFQSECVPRAKQMVQNHFTSEKMAERWTDYLVSVVEGVAVRS